MTVQQWAPQEVAPVVVSANIVRLVDAFKESEAAYALAERLTLTSFCPKAFVGKPGEAAAAMMAGAEIGLSPLAALGAFDVIEGRAAARAITLRAVAQARGHELVLVESTDTKCKMKGRRAGSDEWQTVLWTIDRARTMGLLGKQNWQKQPQAMLVARATSELGRLIASDALLGLGGGYSSEELADGDYPTTQVTVVQQAPAPAARKLAYRPSLPMGGVDPNGTDAGDIDDADPETGEIVAEAPAPAQAAPRTLGRRRPPEPEPSIEEQQETVRDLKDELQQIRNDSAPVETKTKPRGEKLSNEQRARLMAQFTRLQIQDRGERLAYTGMVLEREVSSANDLTAGEASLLLTHLAQIDSPVDAAAAVADESGAIEAEIVEDEDR